MSGEAGPVFLQRRTYRRRRLKDAARLLPFLGAILFSVPLLWQGTPEAPTRTSSVMLYLFVVWAGLAGLSAVISRHLDDDQDDDTHQGDPPERP